jgi:hypothetical protein
MYQIADRRASLFILSIYARWPWGYTLLGERTKHRATLAQAALRPIDKQPHTHTTSEQAHVMSEKVLPFFQGGQWLLFDDDLGGDKRAWHEQC